MQGPLDVLREVVSELEQVGIEYYLVGSLAAMHYGKPRFTNDIDLVLQIPPEKVREFESRFSNDRYYCPPREVIDDEVLRAGNFNLIHDASGVKIDIVILKRTEFAASEFGRRRRVKLLPDLEVTIASPEDIVVKKLDFYKEGGSEKHLTDIRGLMIETEVDQEYLERWVGKLGLNEAWGKVRGSS